MKSVIEDIFYSNRDYIEKVKPSRKYLTALNKYQEYCEKLIAVSDGDKKQIFDDLLDITNVLEREFAETNLKEGFKLGMMIAIGDCGD